jgi:hypothetical protein
MASKRLMTRIVDELSDACPISAAIAKPAVSRKKSGKSEKRRLAALKTWEKRRKKQSIAASEEIAIVPSNDDVEVVLSLPPEVDISPSDSSLCTAAPVNKRSIAAFKTWEKRRANQGRAQSKPASIVPSIDDEQDACALAADSGDSLQVAAECITSSSNHARGKVSKRSLAALKTWEKRRQKQGIASIKPDVTVSNSDDTTLSEGEDNDATSPHSTNGYVRKHKKGYTAELRSQAAKAAWDRRKRLKTMRQTATHDVTDISEEDSAASKQTEPKPKPKKQKTWQDPELKRSRPRRTSQEVESVDETQKDANQVITHLKHSRGWMEFHPSSRYGNGTADYAYIPGSLAQLIRIGAFSKPIVMEHGILGIHYALDYEGYGGLKEMIETFGEDYSPCPSDRMIEASHELQEKKDSKMEQWDLGEDLPWKEVMESEDPLMNNDCDERREELYADDVPADIEEVASILASLCEVEFSATELKPTSNSSSTTSATMKGSTSPNNTSSPKSKSKPSYSPALNALSGYDSESSDDDDSESSVIEPDNSVSPELIQSSSSAAAADAAAGSLGTSPSLLCNRYNSEANVMFGVPLYNPMLNNYNREPSEESRMIEVSYEEQNDTHEAKVETHESSEDGIHFIQDNQKVMLLTPLEEPLDE